MAKDLHNFLETYEAKYPEDIIHIDKEINSNQEITAIAIKLEKQDKYPVLYFHNVINAEGKKAEQPVVTNVLASRVRRARICNSSYETLGRDIHKATRQAKQKPEVISKSEAPVKNVIKTGERINLFEFPALVHCVLDAGYYFSAGFLTTHDPDTGTDNCALQRGWILEKDVIRVFITKRPAHNAWNLYKHEQRNQGMKVCYWLGHHPLAYIGALTKLPYPSSHWEAAGGMLGEPFRLVPSESLGDDFLVPADAEIVVEGVLEANKRYAEGPFGEYPGYYGGHILNPQWKVTAITHRKDAIWYNIVAGFADHPGTGAGPLEGLLWEHLKPRFPALVNVYMPTSGVGRYHVYLQFKNPGPGEARQAIAYACVLHGIFLKHVFAFDDDVDIFNPKDVMWAIATRSQWDRDVIILPQFKTSPLDPSAPPVGVGDLGAIGGIDCTRPWGEPYEVRVGVAPEVMERVNLEDFISAKDLDGVSTERM